MCNVWKIHAKKKKKKKTRRCKAGCIYGRG